MKKISMKSIRCRAAILTMAMLMVAGMVIAQSDTTMTQAPQEKSREHKKKSDHFIPYAGISANHFIGETDRYETEFAVGYMLGFDYQRGRLLYWQLGLRYNNAIYLLKDMTVPNDTIGLDDVFGVKDIDLPVTIGLNLLWFTDRVVGLRVFLSAIPAYVFKVGDNEMGLTEDHINAFNLYGRLGAALDVAFLEISAGYNFGFTDVLSDYQSKPGQAYFTLGFRF